MRWIKIDTSLRHLEIENVETYGDLIRMVLITPPVEGFTVDEMRLSARIVNAFDKDSGDILILTDDEYDYLKARVVAMRWRMYSPDILVFVGTVENAETHVQGESPEIPAIKSGEIEKFKREQAATIALAKQRMCASVVDSNDAVYPDVCIPCNPRGCECYQMACAALNAAAPP